MSSRLATLVRVKAGAAFNRTWALPIVAVSPTSRCHSRCVSCDWWKSDGADDLAVAVWDAVAADLQRLGTRLVVVTGGEPLLRQDVWPIVRGFHSRGMTLQLLTSGLALRAHADHVARYCRDIVISLDGSTPGRYAHARGIDGLAAVRAGVQRLRAVAPKVRVTARATIHRHNFDDLQDLVGAAREMGVDRLSFLAADLTSSAFGRQGGGQSTDLALSSEQVDDFRRVIDRCVIEEAAAFRSGFVAESPARLARLADYFAAHIGLGPFPAVRCDAPFVSVVIDADGTVRPCFFHAGLGNVRDQPLAAIVTEALPAFRGQWSPDRNPTCIRCVCSLTVGWGRPPWA